MSQKAQRFADQEANTFETGDYRPSNPITCCTPVVFGWSGEEGVRVGLRHTGPECFGRFERINTHAWLRNGRYLTPKQPLGKTS